MEEINNILETLIAQHRVLQKDLIDSLALSILENPDIPQIDAGMKKFLVDLPEHLNLENNIFYPNLLEKMKKKNIDTIKTEAFIAEMIIIGNAVMAFSDKYKTMPLIESQFDNFKKELSNIISVLNTRIESEESGVYLYWGMYN